MPGTYFYLNSDQQPVGPMGLDAIHKLAEAGVVDVEVLVCAAGNDDWKPLSQWKIIQSEITAPPRVAPPLRPPAVQSPLLVRWQNLPHVPEWLPLVSMATGIFSLLLFSFLLPVVAFLLAVIAIVSGTWIIKTNVTDGRGFGLTGIISGALGILLLLLGVFGGSEAAAIENALAQSSQIGQDAGKRYSSDSVRRAKFIALELQKVDIRGCPPEFRVAYQRNVNAWEIAIPYFEANNPAVWFLEGLFGGMTKDYSGVGLSDYKARLATQNIADTYRELKAIAVAYGARIPTP